MKVRRVQRGDEALWLAAVTSLIAAEDRDHKLISPPELGQALNDTRCYLYLALLEQEPVGLLSAYRFPDLEAGGQIVYIYDIEVAPEHRRKGVGALLIRQLEAQCKRDGANLIWAGTERANIAARKLFEGTGALLEGDTYVEYEWELEA